MSKHRVYLAVGHGVKPDGGYDPGATGNGWTEQSAGDVIVREAARLLKADGRFAVQSEHGRRDPNYYGTVKAANRFEAKLLVAIHHDWSGGLQGSYGFWLSAAGKRAADAIVGRLRKAGQPFVPSWHKRRSLYVLRRSAMPATLIEIDRIGGPRVDTEAELKVMGRAVAEGVADYFGETLRGEVKAESVTAVKTAADGIAAIAKLLGVGVGRTVNEPVDVRRVVAAVARATR